MSETDFNDQIDEVMMWVRAMPSSEEIRDGIIEECATNLATWYPDHACTNAFCAALRSMKGPSLPQAAP